MTEKAKEEGDEEVGGEGEAAKKKRKRTKSKEFLRNKEV